jgi:hypothetical protein
MSEVLIGFQACHGQDRGEWFVYRRHHRDPDWCGVTQHEYLHADGEWRGSTFSGEGWGEPTGYFATKEDAKAALAKAFSIEKTM